MKPISRRSFIGFAGAGCAAAAIAIWQSVSASASATKRLLRSFSSDADSLRSLGNTYLRAQPATTRDLEAALAPNGVVADEWFGRVTKDAFADRVRELVAQDWRAGRITVVDGWRLSVTEARLCALAARVT